MDDGDCCDAVTCDEKNHVCCRAFLYSFSSPLCHAQTTPSSRIDSSDFSPLPHNDHNDHVDDEDEDAVSFVIQTYLGAQPPSRHPCPCQGCSADLLLYYSSYQYGSVFRLAV